MTRTPYWSCSSKIIPWLDNCLVARLTSRKRTRRPRLGAPELHLGPSSSALLDYYRRVSRQSRRCCCRQILGLLRLTGSFGFVPDQWPNHDHCLPKGPFLLPRTRPKDWPLGSALRRLAVSRTMSRQLRHFRDAPLARYFLDVLWCGRLATYPGPSIRG